MEDLNETGKEVFCHQGVIVRSPTKRDTDDSTSECNGTLRIVQYSFGKCIEWKPIEVLSEVSDGPEADWSIVTTVGQRTRTSSSTSAGSWESRMQPVRIEIRDLKSYKMEKQGRYLKLMQKGNNSPKTFYFQYGNADSVVNVLNRIVMTRRSARDRNLFEVVEDEARSLNTSFAELNLFPENPTDVVWKFMSNLKDRPYETTMETFSKLSDALLYKQPDQRPDDEVAELLNRSLSAGELNSVETEDDYQIIPSLPARPDIKRSTPLTVAQWTSYMNEMGIITDPQKIKEIVFRGGVSPQLRYIVWKYLLGHHHWDLTFTEQQELLNQKVDEYFRMKLQWRTISSAQEERFSDFRDRKSLIEKDVNRTDRIHPFFEGDNNANLCLLNDILMTFVMYNFDLGYVQGMSDLLSPILILLSTEVDAFWCFVGLMDRVHRNFDLDQAGMKKQLSQLHCLLMAAEPELAVYLDQHDSANMFFCFRWLLVLFKREFSHDDILRLWEVIFTDLPCPNFHLLICVAILDFEKNLLVRNKYGFNEILKHVNDLSMRIDVDDVICRAESIYLQLAATPDLPTSVKQIIGLAPPNLVVEDNLSQDLDSETLDVVDAEILKIS